MTQKTPQRNNPFADLDDLAVPEQNQAPLPAEASTTLGSASVVNAIPTVAPKRKRDRSWDKANSKGQVTYRGVPPALLTAIKQVAEDVGVTDDEIARAFLEFGLVCYDRGEILLDMVYSGHRHRLTLFPDDPSARPGWYEAIRPTVPSAKKQPKRRLRGNNERKDWEYRVTYWGFPPALKERIKTLYKSKDAPAGEVVTMLMGHALEAYQNGRLVLSAQSRVSSLSSTEDTTRNRR